VTPTLGHDQLLLLLAQLVVLLVAARTLGELCRRACVPASDARASTFLDVPLTEVARRVTCDLIVVGGP
jgi:hypothetical protein